VPSLKPIAPAWGWRQLEPEGPTTDINRDVGGWTRQHRRDGARSRSGQSCKPPRYFGLCGDPHSDAAFRAKL